MPGRRPRRGSAKQFDGRGAVRSFEYLRRIRKTYPVHLLNILRSSLVTGSRRFKSREKLVKDVITMILRDLLAPPHLVDVPGIRRYAKDGPRIKAAHLAATYQGNRGK